MYPFRYLTVWVLCLHFASVFIDWIPNLIPLAVYTFVGSVLNNIFVNKEYDFFIDLMLHVLLPAVCIIVREMSGHAPPVVTKGSMVVCPVFIFWGYLVWHKFNFPAIYLWYSYPKQYAMS